MKSPIPDYLGTVLAAIADDDSGAPANYIPELAHAPTHYLGVALATADGSVYPAGDCDVEFSIQSISKPFAYALAIEECGLTKVLARVGVEPSGEAFNELTLEADSGRPLNPMINAGAITVHTLIKSGADRLLALISACAGRQLRIDEALAHSEFLVADRNKAIAYMLKNHGIIEMDPLAAVLGYSRQCSIMLNLKDLAAIGSTLANGGIQPVTGEQIFSSTTAQQVLSVMLSCGMYNGAGDWVCHVGLPAKSGVAGAILGVLPGQLGIATFSPRLDHHGNSTRGVAIFRQLSSDMDLHIMKTPPQSRSAIRRTGTVEDSNGRSIYLLSLQGAIAFPGAETIVRKLTEAAELPTRVALDLRRVASLTPVALTMIMESLHRLQAENIRPAVIDPEGLIPAEVVDALFTHTDLSLASYPTIAELSRS